MKSKAIIKKHKDGKVDVDLRLHKDDLDNGRLTRVKHTELLKQAWEKLGYPVKEIDYAEVGYYTILGPNDKGLVEISWSPITIPEEGLKVTPSNQE